MPSPSPSPSSSPTRLRAALSRGRAKGPYAPSTPQADVSRLLDPDYAYGSAASLPAHAQHARKARRASAPVGAYVDNAGELHDPDFRDFPLTLNARRRRCSEEDSDHPIRRVHGYTPTWERAGMFDSARTSTEDAPARLLQPYYTPSAYPNPSFAWSSSPASASSDERPLQTYRSSYHASVDEDGVPRTPSLDAPWMRPRRRRSTKKLKKQRMEEMHDEEEDVADSLPLPTPFASMLAEPTYPIEEPQSVAEEEV